MDPKFCQKSVFVNWTGYTSSCPPMIPGRSESCSSQLFGKHDKPLSLSSSMEREQEMRLPDSHKLQSTR